MKPKHLAILGGLFVVLIVVYSISSKDRSGIQTEEGGLSAGDKILTIGNINNITGLIITDSENSAQLGRKKGKWAVVNRDDYNADFTKIYKPLDFTTFFKAQYTAQLHKHTHFDIIDQFSVSLFHQISLKIRFGQW